MRTAASLLDAGLKEAERRRREHHPGGEAERGVQQPLRGLSNEDQR